MKDQPRVDGHQWNDGLFHPLFPCQTVMVGEDGNGQDQQRTHEAKEYLWNSPGGVYQIVLESFQMKDKYWEKIEDEQVLHALGPRPP